MPCSTPTSCAVNAPSSSSTSSQGRCAIDAVLTDPPAFVQTAKVADLLLAVPKYGPVKVNKLLGRCQIAPTKTIGGLSRRQREQLVALLTN